MIDTRASTALADEQPMLPVSDFRPRDLSVVRTVVGMTTTFVTVTVNAVGPNKDTLRMTRKYEGGRAGGQPLHGGPLPPHLVDAANALLDRVDLDQYRNFAVGLLSSLPECETYNSGDCIEDGARSRDAEYGAERYCFPCQVRDRAREAGISE